MIIQFSLRDAIKAKEIIRDKFTVDPLVQIATNQFEVDANTKNEQEELIFDLNEVMLDNGVEFEWIDDNK